MNTGMHTDSLQAIPVTSRSKNLEPGALIGDYIVEGVLGQGGMGTVYAAVHSVIGKRVAIKLLRRELCENPDVVARFGREARAVNQIGHPNIIDVFGFGETADRRVFLVMELLTGTSLGDRIEDGQLPLSEVCEILIEITHALEAAHDHDIVHRDLKPDNVFLTNNHGRTAVKLLDFGVAKLLVDKGLLDYTAPGTLVGTPQYMAPEQVRGSDIDGRADIYALGVMLFELLVGRPPFTGGNPIELAAKHITREPPIPSELAPELPPIADILIGEMLHKRPEHRPSLGRVRELLRELSPRPLTRSFADGTGSTRAITEPLGLRPQAGVHSSVSVVIPISWDDNDDIDAPEVSQGVSEPLAEAVPSEDSVSTRQAIAAIRSPRWGLWAALAITIGFAIGSWVMQRSDDLGKIHLDAMTSPSFP